MKKTVILFITFLLLVHYAFSGDTTPYILEIVEPPRFEHKDALLLGDTIRVDFNILDARNQQRGTYIDDTEGVLIETTERIGNRFFACNT